jgi:hypothetical protein
LVSPESQRVFVAEERLMTVGQPALLKTRREMRSEDAAALWLQLKSYGWMISEAAW